MAPLKGELSAQLTETHRPEGKLLAKSIKISLRIPHRY